MRAPEIRFSFVDLAPNTPFTSRATIWKQKFQEQRKNRACAEFAICWKMFRALIDIIELPNIKEDDC